MQLKRVLSLLIIVAIVSVGMTGCGASSKKMNAVENWIKEYTQAYADVAKQYVGKTVDNLTEEDTPEKASKLEEEKYPYNPDETYGDVITADFDLKENSIIMYFRVPIGEEDKEIAQKQAGKEADEYYVESRLIIETDNKELTYDNLLDAKITKIRVEGPEIVAGEE